MSIAPEAPCRVVSNKDWDAYRDIITELYQDRDKKLKDVMKIMREQYRFDATAKMYKDRFKRWGLQKNLTATCVGELLRQKVDRDAVGKPASDFCVRGKKIPPKRVETYLRRTKKTELSGFLGQPGRHQETKSVVLCRTPSPVSSISIRGPCTATNPNLGIGTSIDIDSMVLPGSLPLPRSTDRLWQERGDSFPVFDNDQIALMATDSFSVLNNLQAGEMMALWRTPSPVPSTSLYRSFAASSSYPGSDSHIGLSSMSLFGMNSHLLPTMNGVWPASQNSPSALDDDTDESIPPIGNHVETSGTPQALVSSVSCRRRSGPSISHLLPLATPHTLSVPEECMHLLRIYVSGNFDSGAWRGENFKKGQKDVKYWYNEAGTAFAMLLHGHIKQGFRLLNKSFNVYKQLLAAPSFVLFYNTYYSILKLSEYFPDVAKEVIRYVCELSQITHQYRHPFGTIMKKIHAVDVSELRQWSASLLDCYSECLESYIDAGSEFMCDLIFIRCFGVSERVELGWLDFHVAEDQIVKALVVLEQYGDLAWEEFLLVKNLLADLYFTAKRYHEARAITLEVLESAESRGLHELASYCYFRLFCFSRAELCTDKGLDRLNQWVAFCSANLGRSHHRTVSALSLQDLYLCVLGRADAANEARQELDAAVDELCAGIEEL